MSLMIVRGLPAVLYRSQIGSARGVIAAALLQATSLPFIVPATMIGVGIGALSAATASEFVAAGLLSALVFPALALSLLRPTMTPATATATRATASPDGAASPDAAASPDGAASADGPRPEMITLDHEQPVPPATAPAGAG